ncbi:16S rRNA (uracil(1498)-N(3))-methyltransferase [Paracandidimonas soli]|uniref:Ribosomal RNA small subunit methyltransferase E n=1 Tax=Paracandidimonas soli TaxID=1917182 RepID=A0A4R3V598_9BURK|nr:16S rRNA (uracil(1498)-N(3))-methyltransferase [Paracandidimonas soli]TCU98477.1 16S rRNA (uracil1498-N3)-methyltransferase [Paracandidimonas soli]
MTPRKNRTAPRFYCPAPLEANTVLTLPEDLAHHAIRVLRLRSGTAITLFDGSGGEYPATLELQGKTAAARLESRSDTENELSTPLVLIQGIPANSKMDWILEKAVELGVHALIPVIAERSPPQPEGGRLEKRRQHWQRIVQSASEQCGRNRLMQVGPPVTLAQAFAAQADDNRQTLLCHPSGLALRETLRTDAPSVALAIGPEGGWSEQECQLAERQGIARVCFGSRVLRTETAGIALVAAATALLGLD